MNYPNEAKLHFLDYWRVVRVRLGLVVLIFLLVVLTAGIISFISPKQYKSFATIEVQPDMTPVRIFENQPTGAALDPKFTQTQFQIITRKGVLYPVIDQLDLCHRWGTPGLPLPQELAYGQLQGMMSLQEIRNTNLIQITVYSTDPKEAAQLANTIAQVYMDQRVQEQQNVVAKSLEQLQQEVHQQEEAVAKAYTDASRLRTEAGIIDPNPDSLENSSRVEDSSVLSNQEKVNDSESEVATLRSRVAQLDRLKSEDLMRTASLLNLNDPVLEQKLPLYQTAQAEKARLLNSGLGHNHPDVRAAQAQIDTLEQQLRQQIDSLRRGLATQLAIAENSLKARQENLNSSQTVQQQKKTASAAYLDAKYRYIQERKLLETAKTRLNTQSMERTMPQRPAYFRDRAEPALFPSKPRIMLNMALGVLAGLVFGVGIAFLLEYLDTSIKTMEDVERAFNTPVLAVIPKDIHVLKAPYEDTPDAEAYRILKTNADINRKKINASIISVVSGGPGEGKSTTVCNLAQIYAAGGAQVLVVDADLRRPAQHRLFDLENQAGLGNYLKGDLSFDDAVQGTGYPSLQVLTSGSALSDAIGLLNSSRMQELMELVRDRYEIVIFDCPPILGVSDASMISTLVDASIVVVQHRRFPRSMLLRVKKALDGIEASLLGIVLNNVDVRHDENYQYYTSYSQYYTTKSGKERSSRKGAARTASANSVTQDDY